VLPMAAVMRRSKIRIFFDRRTCTTKRCVNGQDNIDQYIRYMNNNKKTKQQEA
jgi:hypothetical protein